MKVTMYGKYYIHFVPVDGKEEVHYHVNAPKPIRVGSAKVWIYSNGRTEIAKQGSVPISDLREICLHIQENYLFYLRKWEEFFGFLKIHGEPKKDFTVAKDETTGDYVVREKRKVSEDLSRIAIFKQKYGIKSLPLSFEKVIIALPETVWIEQEPMYADMVKQTLDKPKTK
ncbi:MAG: hypothetical protein FWG68_12110 [Defluviitaleaceae bacterium]|nr:hypothetical protein [Defluviitaleaceae bacterium]